MKCFSVSSMLTTAAGIGAALQGAVAAPGQATRSGTAITHIENHVVPAELHQSLARNYQDCRLGMDNNPRIFGSQSETGKGVLCFLKAATSSALKSALGAPAAEIARVREGISRQADLLADAFRLEVDNAGHSAQKLLDINFRDYRQSAESSYPADLARLADLLRTQIPPAQRVSMKVARQAAAEPSNVLAREGLVEQLTRGTIAALIELANIRAMGNPESINMEQLDDLRDDLREMQFGNSSLKRRMLKDALKLVVDEHRAAQPTHGRLLPE